MNFSLKDIKFLKDYHIRAINTAVYPNKGSNLIYPVLGLIDEIGETIEKLQLISNVKNEVKIEDVIAEYGDVLWYFNAVTYELRELSNKYDYTTYHFHNYIDLTKITSSVSYKDDTTLVKNLVVYVSKLAGLVKKGIRDNEGAIPKEKLHKAFDYLLLSLNCYQRWIIFLNQNYNCTVGLLDIAKLNIEKLEDRKERNVLKGDGDKR